MSMLNNATIKIIKDSTFVVNTKDNSAFEKLKNAATPSAFHSFVGRPQPARCYPNTRVDVLRALERWSMCLEVEDDSSDSLATVSDSDDSWGSSTNASSNDDSHSSGTARFDEDRSRQMGLRLPNVPIIWLNGGAGAGKSAVAQTFAERCEDLGHLVASFFFFSTDSTRNGANSLVATLAYQIAGAEPGAGAHIESVIHRDPHIFNRDLKRQFTSLIIDPFLKLMQTPSPKEHHLPCTVIIDGLDECTGDKEQAGIVSAICDSLRTRSSDPQKMLPRFLICSRPEEAISRVFRSPTLQGMFTSIDLSHNDSADDDIGIFLEGKFAEIRETHLRADLIPATWPSRQNLSQLQYNSSGHFIYADTVMKFVSTDVRPVNALEIILGLRASPQRALEPFAELDVLYHHILSRALEKSNIDTIRLVFGFLAMENSPSSLYHPDTLEKFLNLLNGELDVLFGITVSLISVKRNGGVECRHKTFGDFLHDKSRAGRFHIEDDAICAYVWAQCYNMISDIASLDGEIHRLMIDCLSCCTKDYDFVSSRKTHSLHGMTQRREVSAFLRADRHRPHSKHYLWAVCSFRYFSSLINLVCSADNDDKLVQQATGDMVSIIKDLSPEPDKHRIPSPGIALLTCLQYSGNMTGHVLKPNKPEICDIQKFLLHIASERRSQKLLALAGQCLEDERMGDCRLSGERFAEACLFWAARLSNPSFFTSQSEGILMRQRSLIMNGAARRLGTPFRWRKTKDSLQHCRRTGRSHSHHGRQTFLLNVQEMRLPERPLQPSFRGGKKPTTLNGKQTTVRDYSKLADPGHCIFLQPNRERIATQFTGKPRTQNGRQKRKEFALILSCIPAMLAKSSKLDAVAALRFKTFPPLARRFPRLTERARQAMKEYAMRHGYPTIDGYFGNSLDQGPVGVQSVESGIEISVPVVGQLSQEIRFDVVDVGVVINTCVSMVWMWFKCLYLLLLAMLGGLNEVYKLRRDKR